MGQQEPDDEPDPQQVAALELTLNAENVADRETMAALYGPLHETLPAPVMQWIQQALATLRNAAQTSARIVGLVKTAREEETYEVPGSAKDVTAFIQAVNYLAHVQWALSLPADQALKQLAGDDAVIGRRIRAQRRGFSGKGNTEKKRLAEQKRQNWLAIGRPLRGTHVNASDSWLAEQIAKRSPGDKASTIRAALPELGLSKRE